MLRLCKMRVLKYYVENKALFGHENKVNENKVLPYCKVLRCETIKNNEKNRFPLCHRQPRPVGFRASYFHSDIDILCFSIRLS